MASLDSMVISLGSKETDRRRATSKGGREYFGESRPQSLPDSESLRITEGKERPRVSPLGKRS